MADDLNRTETKTGAAAPAAPVLIEPPEKLSRMAANIDLERPTLREVVATRVLDLFSLSLMGTLAFAAFLVIIDAGFILWKVIKPDERLMTPAIIMTFVTATVVQVGAAIAAIVLSVFKTENETARKEDKD